MTTETDFSLPEIPDISAVEGGASEPWSEGWYEGVVLGESSFVDRNGNERVFATEDTTSAKGDSRNIRLQLAIKRQSDGKTFDTNTMINYHQEDLTPAVVQAVTERLATTPNEMGDLFRPFMTLQRLGRLQRIAGVRQFQRNGNGGLDLTPVVAKRGYFRLRPDPKNASYKEIAEFSVEAPK